MIKKLLRYLERKSTEKYREVARLIGEYYLEKQDLSIKERYVKAREEILSLGITEIKTKDITIIITLQRPGLLIGRRGENIEKLKTFISSRTLYKNIEIKEDNIICWCVPYD